ncbi:MAG: methyltransferase [Armatimonadetes bacterium]|nr:methyltransferase [Candidatus Hippobium faecium]
MNSIYRERFENTVLHKPVDRCPIDLAGTCLTTVTDTDFIPKIAEIMGFKGKAPDTYDRFDERILTYFDIDFRRTGNIVDFRTGREKKISETEHTDCFGIKYRWSGTYFEISEYPLAGTEIDELAEYEFPSMNQTIPGQIEEWGEKAEYLYNSTPYVISAEHPVFGVLELACWLCGYEHLLFKLADDPEYIHLLFSKILKWQKEVIKLYYGRLGKYIHFTTSGDDFGTQRGCFISPKMFREYVKPYFKERIEYTAQFTDALYWHHTCGSVFDIIPDLADCGVKILNPIQPKAANMNPQKLKEAYGNIITFHGGLDIQEVLPSIAPKIIEEAVYYLLDSMKPKETGGFIFSAAHSIPCDVNPASVVSMYEAVLKYFSKN